MSENLHKDWLPIGLPNDCEVLRRMLIFEKRFGSQDVVERIETKIMSVSETTEKRR